MNKKPFNPEKYNMKICPYCSGEGYIQQPNRQCCQKCGGFGYIKKEGEEDKPTASRAGNQGSLLPPGKVTEQ